MKLFSSIVVFIMIISAGVFLGIKYANGGVYNFSAKSVNGDVTLKSFEGKYKIIYFGFGSCPDVCPATLGLVSSVLGEIKRDDIVVLFITLDPERDTPQAMDEYAKYFYPNSYGLVVDNLKKVTQTYGAKYKKIRLEKSAMDYSVAHSSSIYLLDKKGKLINEVSNLTIENIRDSIKELVKN